MKKSLSMLLALLLLFVSANVVAEDTGIQVIGAPAVESEPVNLADWKEGETAKIPDFGDITLVSCEFVDTIPYKVYLGSFYGSDGEAKESFESGSMADYLRIRIKILNTQKKAFDYCKVLGDDIACTFGDGYQFGGWARQERKEDDRFWTMYQNKDSSYEIGSLYYGYFDVVVTLPNYVVNSKEPLSVTFSIGDNEFTIHVRK